MRRFHVLSLRTQFVILLGVFIGVMLVAATVIGRAVVVSQTLNEGRSVAQMVEYIGSWGSRYGGVHVRTTGHDSPAPGTYLERRVYTSTEGDQAVISGHKLASVSDELQAFEHADAYHWKNPALIQREISDIAQQSTSGVKFRLTARSVINPNNAPNEFEKAALESIAARVLDDAAAEPSAPLEYTEVAGNRLLYARSMTAAKSCLRCHGSPERAPGFLKSNPEFDPTGGFGYQEGQPAGIISVSLPLPATSQALASSMTVPGWVAVGSVVAMATLILYFVVRRVINPMNRLRLFADTLASARSSAEFQDVALPPDTGGAESRNEVHRLADAIGRLGQSLRYLYDRASRTRQQ